MASEGDIKRSRVDAAMDERDGVGLGDGVGQIDVPITARAVRGGEDLLDSAFGQGDGGGPILGMRAAVELRDGDSGDAEEGGLAGRGHGARSIDISAKIAAVVDAGEDPVEGLAQPSESDANAVRRGAVEMELAGGQFGQSERRGGGDPVANVGLLRSGSEQGDFAEVSRCGA